MTAARGFEPHRVSPSKVVGLRLGGKGRRVHWRLMIAGVQVARGKGMVSLRASVWAIGKDMAFLVQHGKATAEETLAAGELAALHQAIVRGKLTPPS